MRTLLLAACLVASNALATPLALNLAHQGFLLGASDAPVNATSQAMTFTIMDDASAVVWTGACDVDVKAGYYAVTLGAPACGPSLTTTHLGTTDARWLQVAVGAVALQPKLLLASTPMATVSVRSLDTDTLRAELSSSAGTLNAPSNPVDWRQLKGVPTAFADGSDDGFTGVTLAASSGLSGAGTAASGLALATDGASLAKVSGGALSASGTSVTAAGTLTATTFAGSGASLTNLPATALSGTVAKANLPALTFADLTGAFVAPNANGEPTGAIAPGTIVWDTAAARLKVFNGNAWLPLSETTAASLGTQANPAYGCRDLKTRLPLAGDGAYWIDPDGPGGAATGASRVYCLQSRAGGGWTKILQYDNATNLGTSAAVNAGGAWTDGATGAGKLDATTISLLWTRKQFMLRTAAPSDGKLMGNGTGYMLWSANAGSAWPEFGTSLRPAFSHTMQCERTGDDVIDVTQTYTQDTRGTCSYGTYWLYDHNYTASPQCYGFGPTVFTSNLHFCGSAAGVDSEGGTTGRTQVFVRD